MDALDEGPPPSFPSGNIQKNGRLSPFPRPPSSNSFATLRSAFARLRTRLEDLTLQRWLGNAAIFILSLAVILGLIYAIQVVPEWQVKRASVRSTKPLPEAETTPAEIATLQNEFRKTAIQVVGGIFALIAVYFTYRRVRVSEQGHITDRYSKAIELLGATTAENKPNIEVRLGAIYALERIAFDSPRNHWTIMEILRCQVRLPC